MGLAVGHELDGDAVGLEEAGGGGTEMGGGFLQEAGGHKGGCAARESLEEGGGDEDLADALDGAEGGDEEFVEGVGGRKGFGLVVGVAVGDGEYVALQVGHVPTAAGAVERVGGGA